MEKESEPQPDMVEFREMLQKFLSRLPDEYSAAHSQAKDIRTAFHEVLGLALQPKLNAYVKTLPHDSYADKQAIAKQVNYETHEMGLCLRRPRTQRRAILVADVRDAQSRSRFRFEVDTEKGKTSRTSTTYDVPDLELIPELPRREGGAKWKSPPSR